MKRACAVLVVLLVGCAQERFTPPHDDLVVLRVVRLSSSSDAGYQTSNFHPPGPLLVYRDIRFRIEQPEEYQGRQIVLPIIHDTEGPLFDATRFTVKIPVQFLHGVRSAKQNMPDGTMRVVTTDALSFEGILVTEADRSPKTNVLPAP